MLAEEPTPAWGLTDRAQRRGRQRGAAPSPPPSRERLLHLLAEAAELEHNLLCSYLFAMFSLKESGEEDLDEEELAAVKRWRQVLLGVCIAEMGHLAQVANLTVAIGSRPHFNRPNLPVPDGYHPAGVAVELTPFDLETLQHFMFLERPEGSTLADGPSFVADRPYVRQPHHGHLMPTGPQYDTVGEFYGVLKAELESFATAHGEAALFIGPAEVQLRPQEIGIETLRVIGNLADADAAVDQIVLEGEGSPAEADASHFVLFRQIQREYEGLLARRPTFRPSRAVGRNPVMRAPVVPARTHVSAPNASTLLDAANGLYGLMLRCLSECYEAPWGDPAREGLVQAALGSMRALGCLASELTQLPAGLDAPGVMAGLSFAMLRSTEGAARQTSGLVLLRERMEEIRQAVPNLPLVPHALARLEALLAQCPIPDAPRAQPAR